MRHACRALARALPLALPLFAAAPLPAPAAGFLEVVFARVGPGDGPPRIVSGLMSRPDGGRTTLPLVIVLHDDAGLDGRTGALAEWLAEQGFATLELDLLPSEHDPALSSTDARQGARELLDVGASLAEARGVDATRIAVVGLGRGGRAALHAVAEADSSVGPRPAAAAALYPGCDALRAEGFSLSPGYGAPVLILAAGAFEGDATCSALRDAARDAAPARFDLHVLPEATYAWDTGALAGASPVTATTVERRGLVRVRADDGATEEARERLLLFLRGALAP